VFTMALSFASGKTAGANLGIFVPFLDEKSVVTLFLGSIDLFFVWATISLAIGLGVLYKRRTGPIATSLLGIYVVIALVIAFFRSGS
jgi:quinol-cytochrome oxidoreductase complex cytochrome b subunit